MADQFTQQALFVAPQSQDGPDLDTLVNKAISLIKRFAIAGHPLVASCSFGKDSTVVLNLILMALKQLQQQGQSLPHVVVLHADTLVENPHMAAHAKAEIEAIRAYGRLNDLPVQVQISIPALLSQWSVKVIGGRDLPVFANKGQRSCTIDLKVTALNKLKKRVMRQLGSSSDLEPIVCLGTRFSESNIREARMLSRRENSSDVWTDKDGLKLSPICDWTDADIWSYLYACSNDEFPSYGNFSNLIKLYRAGSSQLNTLESGLEIPICRFGCSICTVGRDRSMEAMLAKGNEFAYMQPLYDLQRFLLDTQFDLDLRRWVGRSIKDGQIAIAPDGYSPDMLESLLKFALTMDLEEKQAAMRLDISPRFEMVSAQALIAIDAIWSQQGIHPAFHALKIFRDIYVKGKRYPIPQTTPGKPAEIPSPRYLDVGKGWEDRTGRYEYCGLREMSLEMTSESGSGCMGTRTLTDGRIVLDAEMSEGEFTVDMESAELILGFELDYLIEMSDRVPRTYGYRHYVALGALQFAKAQMGMADTILRRTSFKELEGIFDMTRDEILAKTEPTPEQDGDMPDNYVFNFEDAFGIAA